MRVERLYGLPLATREAPTSDRPLMIEHGGWGFVYVLTRLETLLRALSVTRLSGRQRLLRWLWVALQAMILCGLVAALFLRPPYIQPATSYDRIGRAFLLSYSLASFASLVSGLYIVASFAHVFSGVIEIPLAKTGPPPEMALALRQAIRGRDPRIAPVAEDARPAQDPALGGAFPNSALVVSAPELLADSPLAAIGMLAVGGIFLAPAVYFTSIFAQLPDHGSLLLIGVLVMLSALAFAAARWWWNSWRASSHGVAVTSSAEGLTIRAAETLGGRRFIPWREARSLARFTYRDDYARTHTVYMLDAGDQTVLWESPPDMRYASPARRAKIAQRQASAARLMALACAATGLPLLDISEIVATIAQIEPDPSPVVPDVSDDVGVITIQVKVAAEDVALLKLLSSTGAETANGGAAPPLEAAGMRLAQWRRFLDALLFWSTSTAAAAWFLTLLNTP